MNSKQNMELKKAIIIGASSGIGRQMAILMSADGIVLGLTGRRTGLLEELKTALPVNAIPRFMDVADVENSVLCLNELIEAMDGVDLILICSGTGFINESLDWELERETIDVNVSGVTALICASMGYFFKRGRGHLAVITSIAALRGSSECPSYNASKAFLSNYLEGMQCKAKKAGLDLIVTEISPGFVDTEMAKGEGLFWVMPVEKACYQIYKRLKAGSKAAYITKRWRVVAFILKRLPKRLYTRFF